MVRSNVFLVEIWWETKLGNPTSTRARVEAKDLEAAMQYLRDRVTQYKRCGKIHAGNGYVWGNVEGNVVGFVRDMVKEITEDD